MNLIRVLILVFGIFLNQWVLESLGRSLYSAIAMGLGSLEESSAQLRCVGGGRWQLSLQPRFRGLGLRA